jgi:hypothetical protein
MLVYQRVGVYTILMDLQIQEQKTCRDMTLICRFHDGN